MGKEILLLKQRFASHFLHFYPPDLQKNDRGAKRRKIVMTYFGVCKFNIGRKLLAIISHKYTAC